MVLATPTETWLAQAQMCVHSISPSMSPFVIKFETDQTSLQDGNGNSVNLMKRLSNIGSIVGNGDNSGNNALNGVGSGNGNNNANGNLVGAGSNVSYHYHLEYGYVIPELRLTGSGRTATSTPST